MSKTLVTTILAAAGLMATALAGPVRAQDAESQSPWQLRVRALGVLPASSGSTVNVLNTPSLSSPNSGLSIGNSIVPELDVSYFFTRNVSAELVLGVTPHNVKGAGSLAGARIGSAWLLPPTLMLQYHFTDLGPFKPYVGVGVNYTVFFNEKAKGGFTDFDLKDSFGVALQAGFDYMLDEHWGLNFDVKKIFLEPKVKVNNGLVSGKVKIDPWLIGAGVGIRF